MSINDEPFDVVNNSDRNNNSGAFHLLRKPVTQENNKDGFEDFSGAGEVESANTGPDRETWLNGWHRNGNSVLIGTGVYCAGCGRDNGVACVAISPDYIAPEKLPDWPFNEADCPLCEWRENLPAPRDVLTERAERLAKARGEKK
jgi:hypothetical protein